MSKKKRVWVQNPETEEIGYITMKGAKFETATPKGSQDTEDEDAMTDETNYSLSLHTTWRLAKRYMVRKGFTKADENSLGPNPSSNGTMK